MVISILVVNPHDHLADWELWLTVAAQYHQERVWYFILLAWEKIKIKNLKYRASLVAQWLRVCLPMQGTRV